MSLTDLEYNQIRKLVYEHSRIDLGEHKKELVNARLGKRLRATKIETYTKYCLHLKSKEGEQELTHLIDAISTNHTFFFRERRHFEFLREKVLPEIHAGAEHGAPRSCQIWSAATASGEEAYSLAIELNAFFSRHPGWAWKVEASDISTRMLDHGRRAIYAADRLREIDAKLLPLSFQKGIGKWENHFRVKESLRRRVHFTHLNLLQPVYPFLQAFPVIWCRNVMIYFDRATQEQLVAKLSRQLLPGGYLFIGNSESLTGMRHGLRQVKPSIYQKS